MKAAVADFGVALADYQHALRLQDSVVRQDLKKAHRELQDGRRENFDPNQLPEWLLLELECNLRIRSDQVEVAMASITPRSGMNSVLQMNMGLGKTSVIMPCIAAHLAGRRAQVMRVIVPRSLLAQTSTILHGRLGRLIGSNVLHVPYSRRTDHSEATTDAFLQLHQNA